MTSHQGPAETTTDGLLLRLLGQQDAAFIPPRYPNDDKWSAWWALRRNYHRDGVPWRSRGTSAMDQKRTERALAELVQKRLVKVARPQTKTLAVRLTYAGDQHARALADLPLGCMPFLPEVLRREILAYHSHPESSSEGGPTPWVPEALILGAGKMRGWGDGHHKELPIVEANLVAPMVRGWVECNSDAHGRTWYRLSRDGVAVAKGDVVPPTISPLPAAIKDGHVVYWNSLCDTIAEIKHIDGGHTREIGEVPLTASMLTKRAAKRK